MEEVVDTLHLGTFGFLVKYENKEMEVWTNNGQYAAIKEAAAAWNVPAKKQYKIQAYLCVDQEGKQVYQSTCF